MKKTIFLDKYPIYTLELKKSEVAQKSIQEVAEYFEAKITAHPVAKLVAIFDNYAHTKAINGEIMEGLTGAMNVLFCFGNAIPDTKILALRPRSIGICEFEDRFIIEFVEAPKEQMHDIMESWAKSLNIQ